VNDVPMIHDFFFKLIIKFIDLLYIYVFLDVRTFDVILQWVKICVTSYFMYRVSHEGKYCTKFLNQYSFSYQTGYIMWHSRLMIYIPFGCASGNIDPKPGMSHYIPCLIAE
jgi:hypothetical protein